MQIVQLLSWPAARVVREAVLVHNLRHPHELLEADSTPWERLVPVIYAFVRHQLSDYDACLAERTGGEKNKKERDKLVAEVIAKARRNWKWLRSDPRPFARNAKEELELDGLARELADCQSLAHHAQSVLRTTSGGSLSPGHRALLKKILADNRARIENLSIPFTLSHSDRSKRIAEVHTRATRTGKDYDFFGLTLASSYLSHLPGVKCPRCHQCVRTTKSPVKLGQGRRRYLFGCHCICLASDTRSIIITAERWAQSIAKALREPAQNEPAK